MERRHCHLWRGRVIRSRSIDEFRQITECVHVHLPFGDGDSKRPGRLEGIGGAFVEKDAQQDVLRVKGNSAIINQLPSLPLDLRWISADLTSCQQ